MSYKVSGTVSSQNSVCWLLMSVSISNLNSFSPKQQRASVLPLLVIYKNVFKILSELEVLSGYINCFNFEEKSKKENYWAFHHKSATNVNKYVLPLF